MKEDSIQVLKIEPGKAPEAVTIPNTLKAMQQMVGGYIEVICPAAAGWGTISSPEHSSWPGTLRTVTSVPLRRSR